MRKKLFIGMLLITMLLLPVIGAIPPQQTIVPTPKIVEWQTQIYASANGGNTYCRLGEKKKASNGIDQFDVVHPPFFPPGRAFIFFSEPSFPNPYNNLWYEFKKTGYFFNVFNLTTFLYPNDGQGKTVTMTWNKSCFNKIGYKTVSLTLDDVVVANMKSVGEYSFWSDVYQMTFFKIKLYR